MHKNKIKEQIKNYILENYSKISEQEKNKTNVLKDLYPEVAEVRDNLFNVADERLIQSLKNIATVEQTGQLIVQMIDFINKETPAPFITKDLAIKYIQGAESRDFNVDDFESEVEIEPETEEESVEEMSTTAGAPAPATKYAFKRKKK